MNQKMNFKNNKAFTLIETLIVIAIIATLIAITIPAASKALDSAKRSLAANNLRQIAIAYMLYTSTENQPIKAKNLYEWTRLFAESTDLNDAHLWYIKDDPLVQMASDSLPDLILLPPNLHQERKLNPDFAKTPLSLCIAANLPLESSPSTTPLAWTRGLQKNGRWAPDSPYKGKGGHIVFLDGHVKWFTSLTTSTPLLNHQTQKSTSNIFEALPPGTKVFDYQGVVFSTVIQ